MNLFKRTTASIALVTLVSGLFVTGVSAYSPAELEAANALAGNNVINAKSNAADYNLDANVLRQEIFKVGAGVAELSAKSTCAGSFSDITATTPNDWVCGYAEALLDNNMLSANATARPTDSISKAEAVKLMLETAGHTGIYTNDNNWQAEVVAYAVDKGVVSNFSDYGVAATRGFVFSAANEAMNADDDELNLEDLLGLDDDEDEDETDNGTDNGTDDGGNTSTSGELEVTLSPLSPSAGAVAAGKDRTPFLAIDVTAGNEDVTLDEITLGYVGLSDKADFANLRVYLGNDQITKQDSKKFDSDKEAELTFENDTVIKAGETKTLVIAGLVTDASTNVSHQIAVLELVANGTVEMDTIRSSVFGTVSATNTAALEVDVDLESGKLELGKVEKLADFSLEEKDDNEDVIVKSLTFEFGGAVDAEDDIADLVLSADGVEIASNLTVNDDDEVIVNLDYTISADDSVDFELEGVITGSIGDSLTVTLTEVYALGADTNVIATVDDDNNSGTTYNDPTLANFSSVDGAEINISFDKSDIDESKPDAEEVLIGTLKIEAASDYTVDELTVTVQSTKSSSPANVVTILKQIELDGDTPDSDDAGTTTRIYTFKDISLKQGVEKTLDLTVDFEDATALNGESLEFTVKVVQVEDEENDETFNNGTTPNLNSVLSSNSFDTQSIDVESANYELTQTNLSQRDLVLGNGLEVVLYQGKLSIGDADSVTFKDLTFNGTVVTSTGAAVSYDFEDIIDEATLNIGGTTESESADSSKIEFTGMNMEVAAGSDNVEVLLTARLKDNDSVANGDIFSFTLVKADVTAEDSDNEDLLAAATTVTAASSLTAIQLQERGEFTINIVNNGENEEEIEDVVLAGTSNVALAEIEFEAEEEDVKVDELRFTIAGSKDTTIKNVRLMDGSTVIDTASSVTFDTTNTIVEFKDFVIEDTGSKMDLLLVADLEIVTTEGGVASATTGNITVQIANTTDIEAKGSSSNDDLTTGNGLTVTTATVSDAVNVVPVIITVSDTDDLGNNDKYATAKIVVDFGDNDLDNEDLYLQAIKLENLSASGAELRNDESDSIVSVASGTGADVDLDVTLASPSDRSLAKINNNDDIEFKVAADDEELRVKKNGFIFFLDLDNDGIVDAGETITSSNENVLDFGEYNEVN